MSLDDAINRLIAHHEWVLAFRRAGGKFWWEEGYVKTDESKLQPLTGAGVSGNEPLAGREERQVPREYTAQPMGPDDPIMATPAQMATLVGSGPPEYRPIDAADMLAAVRAIVAEEVRKALRETFQR